MTDQASSTPGASSERSGGLVRRIVGWLRAGYPDGVPQGDYVALLGILGRTLTPTEVDTVVSQLSDVGGVLTREHVEASIERLLLGSATPADIERVSGRLASAGWPLGLPDDAEADAPVSSARVGLIGRVVRWLREGYPTGLPDNDFVPLVALLRRRLTDDEVTEVGARLTREGVLAPDRVDVGAAIAAVTSELPSDSDVERVRRYLADHGWPLDFPV